MARSPGPPPRRTTVGGKYIKINDSRNAFKCGATESAGKEWNKIFIPWKTESLRDHMSFPDQIDFQIRCESSPYVTAIWDVRSENWTEPIPTVLASFELEFANKMKHDSNRISIYIYCIMYRYILVRFLSEYRPHFGKNRKDVFSGYRCMLLQKINIFYAMSGIWMT